MVCAEAPPACTPHASCAAAAAHVSQLNSSADLFEIKRTKSVKY